MFHFAYEYRTQNKATLERESVFMDIFNSQYCKFIADLFNTCLSTHISKGK